MTKFNVDKALILKGVGLLLTVGGSIATAAGVKIDTKKVLTELVKAELEK